MKRVYYKMMRKIVRFIVDFESCPIDCRRDLLSNLRNLLINIASATITVLLMTYMMVAWA